MAQTYTIEINESQRVGLVELFELYSVVHGQEPPCLEHVLGMLRTLPDYERLAPGAVHAFNL